jgi:transcriptional regulator with XRE-family HTH domain
MKPTQTGAGRLIGLSQPSVNDWTLGSYPTMENAIALAEKLNVTVEWLLTERGPKRPLPQDALAQELWDMWPQLDATTKGRLIGIASGLLQRLEEDAPEKHRRA